jgi:hypothetical protein
MIRHLAYFQLGESRLYQAYCNLDEPRRSWILRAPLDKSAGGLGLCGEGVFESADDPDYQEILAAVQDSANQLAHHKRFDMPGFRPNRFYEREMQNFGVLPRPLPEDYRFDVYEMDQCYWRSCRK